MPSNVVMENLITRQDRRIVLFEPKSFFLAVFILVFEKIFGHIEKSSRHFYPSVFFMSIFPCDGLVYPDTHREGEGVMNILYTLYLEIWSEDQLILRSDHLPFDTRREFHFNIIDSPTSLDAIKRDAIKGQQWS